MIKGTPHRIKPNEARAALTARAHVSATVSSSRPFHGTASLNECQFISAKNGA
ncbi:hypothetical protein [Streptomyces puniciscabiei]|uniref:hypothetical protein n=1 Tax=Streptomyces puniciscabiei TaxID=164348 RepID=UPI0033228254